MAEGRGQVREGQPTAPGRRISRPRQAEVAKLAGVSQTTVSVVLTDSRRGVAISERTLGVFSFTAMFPTSGEHACRPFVVGAEQQAAELGYEVVLFTGSSFGLRS